MLQAVTATGARPQAFALLCRYVQRQTYSGPVRWLVVDDCDPATPMPADLPSNWTLELIRPAWRWKPGQNTQIANLRLALDRLDGDAPVTFMEDDEHYAADWLERLAQELSRNDIVGQRLCRKYNLRTRRALEVNHPYRASLCATAIKGKGFGRLRRIVSTGPKLIDCALWRPGVGHLFDGAFVTSFKGMPGRGGIDSGHSGTFGKLTDPEGTLLRAWVGDQDAQAYEALMQQMQPTRNGEIEAYVDAYLSPTYRMGVRRRASVQALVGRLPRGSLLDVGTGRAETLAFAKAAGHGPVMGTEVVPALLGDDVVYAEAHALPFADGSWDHVTCFDVLEHLIEADLEPALREMLRVARRTVTVSASERSDIREGRELHISKRPAAEWLALLVRCWGRGVRPIGSAGASPCFQVVKR